MISVAIHNLKNNLIGNFQVPEGWIEMDWLTLKRVAPLFFSGGHTYEAKANAFRVLSSMGNKFFHLWYTSSYQNERTAWEEGVELIQTIELIDWLFKRPSLDIPIKRWLGVFKLPGTDLEDITVDHFSLLDPFFTMALDNPDDEELLNDFVSMLVRPLGFKFSEHRTNWIARLTAMFLRKRSKQGLLIQYMAMRNQLTAKYDKVFKSGGDSEKSFDPEWVKKLAMDLPNDKFGSITAIEQTPIIKVLDFLQYEFSKPKPKKK